ncbi:MAG: pyridoxal 5'-phosphate synthase glutaminase subunit PdxT [Vulcanimicrobiaceae bacterium]
MSAPRIGVLALQGDVAEHLRALADVGAEPLAVKTRERLETIEGLVIPGGESTTLVRLLERFGLEQPLVARVRAGLPLWGTCMGMILAAREVVESEQPTLGLLDIAVRRNAFGRQLASAEIPLAIPALGEQPFPAVFIRAPWVERAGPGVEVLAEREGHPVFVRAQNVLASAFHPELTADRRIHALFLDLVRRSRRRAA